MLSHSICPEGLETHYPSVAEHPLSSEKEK